VLKRRGLHLIFGDEPAHAQFEQKVRDRAKLTIDAAESIAEAMA
jgi:hypothetical protein